MHGKNLFYFWGDDALLATADLSGPQPPEGLPEAVILHGEGQHVAHSVGSGSDSSRCDVRVLLCVQCTLACRGDSTRQQGQHRRYGPRLGWRWSTRSTTWLRTCPP